MNNPCEVGDGEVPAAWRKDNLNMERLLALSVTVFKFDALLRRESELRNWTWLTALA